MTLKELIQTKKRNILPHREVLEDIITIMHTLYPLLQPMPKDKLNYESLLKMEGIKEVMQALNNLNLELKNFKEEE